jgi:hypothetical protein
MCGSRRRSLAPAERMAPLGSLRYEWALPLPRDEAHAHHLFALCLALVGCSALVVALIGALASPIVTRWTGVSGRPVGLLPVAIFVFGLHAVVTGWLVPNWAFVQLARGGESQRLARMAGALSFDITIIGSLRAAFFRRWRCLGWGADGRANEAWQGGRRCTRIGEVAELHFFAAASPHWRRR